MAGACRRRGKQSRELGFERENYWEHERTNANSPRLMAGRGSSGESGQCETADRGAPAKFGEQLSTRENKRKRRKGFGGFADLERSSAKDQTSLGSFG